jgi:hypothetical protein
LHELIFNVLREIPSRTFEDTMLSKRTHIAIATTAAGPSNRPCERLRALVCSSFTQKSTLLEQTWLGQGLRQPD